MDSIYNKFLNPMNALSLKTAGNRRGAALIGVVIIAIILSLSAAGMIVVATSASKNETVALDDSRALLAAESGLLLGAAWINDSSNSVLLKSLSTIPDIIPSLIINDITVQVDIEKTAAGALIKSTAQSAGRIKYNKMVSQNARSTKYPFDTTAFDYAIICGGTFGFAGCGDISAAGGGSASLHSNSTINITGDAHAGSTINITSCAGISTGNKTIDANLTGPVLNIHQNATINGDTLRDSIPNVPIPDIDLLPYFYEALYNGEVKTSFSSSNYTPKGGILWVNGEVGPINGGTFNGTIIATGNVKLAGDANVNPANGFAIASLYGNINIQTSGTINGLVYAKTGNYTQTANGSLNGQLVVKGSISKGGNSDIVVYNKIIPNDPNTGNATGYKLLAGTWLEQNI